MPPAALTDLGSAEDVARLLLRNRDREASSGTLLSELVDAAYASDGSLRFSFLTPLAVADPDELEKQRGVRELKRRSSAVAQLGAIATGGATETAVVSAWGSAKQEDWESLGRPLEEAVGSFAWSAPGST